MWTMRYYSMSLRGTGCKRTKSRLKGLFSIVTFLCGIETFTQPHLELRDIELIDSSSSVRLALVVHANAQAIAIRANYWIVDVTSGGPRFGVLCTDVPSIHLGISEKAGPVGSIACNLPVLRMSERSVFYTIQSLDSLSIRVEIPFDSAFYSKLKRGQQFWMQMPYWDAKDMYRFAIVGRMFPTISRDNANVYSYEYRYSYESRYERGDSREIIIVPRDEIPDVVPYRETLPDDRIVGLMSAVGYR
jgi:hypothetical protein